MRNLKCMLLRKEANLKYSNSFRLSAVLEEAHMETIIRWDDVRVEGRMRSRAQRSFREVRLHMTWQCVTCHLHCQSPHNVQHQESAPMWSGLWPISDVPGASSLYKHIAALGAGSRSRCARVGMRAMTTLPSAQFCYEPKLYTCKSIFFNLLLNKVV